MAAPSTNIDSGRGTLLVKLKPLGQEHLVAFWDRLDERERDELTCQIDQIDGNLLRQLQRQHREAAAGEDDKSHWGRLAARAQSPPAMLLDGSGVAFSQDEARRAANLLESQGYGVVVAPVLGE